MYTQLKLGLLSISLIVGCWTLHNVVCWASSCTTYYLYGYKLYKKLWFSWIQLFLTLCHVVSLNQSSCGWTHAQGIDSFSISIHSANDININLESTAFNLILHRNQFGTTCFVCLNPILPFLFRLNTRKSKVNASPGSQLEAPAQGTTVSSFGLQRETPQFCWTNARECWETAVKRLSIY